MSEIKITVVDDGGNPRFIATAPSMEAAVADFGQNRVAVGEPPSFQHVWAGGQWAPRPTAELLAMAKAAAWQRIKRARASRLVATFTCAGKVYDCNRDALNSAACSAMLAKAALNLQWTRVWVLADNTTATLTADQMLQVAAALENHINSLWATSRALRTQINSATTVAAVEAINWP